MATKERLHISGSAATFGQDRKILRRSRTKNYESGTSDLAEMLSDIDRQCPGWDHDATMAGIERALKSGFPREMLVERFGEKLIQVAEEAVAS